MLTSNESKQVLYARFTTAPVDQRNAGATGGGAPVANRWRVSALALPMPTIRYSGTDANQHVYSRYAQLRG